MPPDSSDSTFGISVRSLGPAQSNVVVEGELDLSSADRLKQVLLDQLADGHSVVLDLAAVRFIDSTGLAAIISAVQRSVEVELTLELRPELQPQVQRLMELTGMNSMFTFAD